MARVTVEDCVQKIPNRFELVMLAAQRSRDISAGSSLTVDRDNDKNPVVALREIADETIKLAEIRDALIRSLQKRVEIDEPEEEDAMELLTAAAMSGDLAIPEETAGADWEATGGAADDTEAEVADTPDSAEEPGDTDIE